MRPCVHALRAQGSWLYSCGDTCTARFDFRTPVRDELFARKKRASTGAAAERAHAESAAGAAVAAAVAAAAGAAGGEGAAAGGGGAAMPGAPEGVVPLNLKTLYQPLAVSGEEAAAMAERRRQAEAQGVAGLSLLDGARYAEGRAQGRGALEFADGSRFVRACRAQCAAR